MVTWILEKDVFSEECFGEMVEHFKSNDIPYHIVRIIPFVHEIEGKVPDVTGPCVVYGSLGIQKLAAKHNWSPGVWSNENFSESVVRDQLGDLYLNDDCISMKMSEISDFIAPGKDDEWLYFFIKPDSDTKEFAGEVLASQGTGSFDQWYSNLLKIGYLTDNDFNIVISKPKPVSKEWRLVVLNEKVIAYSVYKQYRQVMPDRSAPQEVIDFAEKAAGVFSPADVFIVDVALSQSWRAKQNEPEELKIVEYNTFNSAGLYKCDVGAIIDGINDWIEN